MVKMILQTLVQVLGMLPSLAILIASIIILIRTRSLAGIFMVIGQSISLIMQVFWTFLWPHIMYNLGSSYGDPKVQWIMGGCSLMGFLGGTFFVIGLFMLIFNHLLKQD